MDVLAGSKALLLNRGEVDRGEEHDGYDKWAVVHRPCGKPMPDAAAKYSQG